MTFNPLEHFGIKEDSIKGFEERRGSSNRLLLYDGDAACYQITSDVKKIDTALRRFEQDILTKLYVTNCGRAKVHLTPRGCLKRGRDKLNTVKPYQGNRVGKSKPPLLEILRANAGQHFKDHPDIEVVLNYDIEADDGLIIDAYAHEDTCLISFDKDLRMNPYPSYDYDEGKFYTLPHDKFGWLDRKQWLSPSGTARSKLIGKGTKFFWGQMLMGDQADHVQGILKLNGKLCGEAAAFGALDPIKNEDECANFVLDAYREINQNVVAEAEAMWLIRTRDDSAYKYISSLDLSPQNRQFLEDTNAVAWRSDDD